ncbi:MAG: hypothetical protein GF384_08960, partial [Elusimicrobia bacterium]|nr:hypothetical protein [Elusimicrobiota bacterium]
YVSNYGWSQGQPNSWQPVEIPLVDFAWNGVDLSQTEIVFLVGTRNKPGKGTIFYLDHIRFITTVPLSSISVSGRQLLINNIPFVMKGVTYCPTPVGEGYQTFDVSAHPEIYEQDLRLIKAMGANTVRIYNNPMSNYQLLGNWEDFLTFAQSIGVYVIMDYPVPHGINFIDPNIRTALTDGFLAMVGRYQEYGSILLWNFGNEMNRNLGGLSPADWYAFVNEVAGLAHQLEFQARGEYHPVISAVGENGDISQEIKEYDQLVPNMDAWAVQIYRGPSFGSLFNLLKSRTNKPIMVSEFGCDAFDRRSQSMQEEQTIQNTYVTGLWTEINDILSANDPDDICVGGLVHSWADDWSKDQWGYPNSSHDTTGQPPEWNNPGYYDYQAPGNYNMNEEWWGICGIFPGNNDRDLREVYFGLQDMWLDVPLMNASINGGENFTWSGPINAGENVWKVAEFPVTVAIDENGLDLWAVQVFTDNTDQNAQPRYTGNKDGNFNLVGRTNTDRGIAMCWKVTDDPGDPGVPVWDPERGGEGPGFTDFQWHILKDREQNINPFVTGESYVRVWDQDGIYWLDHVSAQPPVCPAVAPSPNYVYVGVQLHYAQTMEYATNRFILEFLIP